MKKKIDELKQIDILYDDETGDYLILEGNIPIPFPTEKEAREYIDENY